ncbi:MAG: GFA family protein [Gammaproteobacteria bacterium]|nr:GFA family protein [Gammaproteobacteria bacterium]
MHEGFCLCGQLRFRAEGDPRWVAHCHCASCRRHTASPVACFVNFRLEQLRFSGERAVRLIARRDPQPLCLLRHADRVPDRAPRG